MTAVRVRVALVPPAARAARDPGAVRACGVAIDVLRATTTLTAALANGARAVVPLADTTEAIALRDRDPGGTLACGERDGRIVPGFDLGNSPFEYVPARVAGRTLAFASTNGSLALRAIAGCRRRLAAAFVNATAVLRALDGEDEVRIVCAGKLGRFALEDAACAGWLCAALAARGARLEGAAARLAAALAPRDAAGVRAVVEGASHGRYLRALGPEYAADVDFCARLDVYERAFEI
uniref:Probable 2-phosphosulfolactate phosphatase n=1 Tax=Eiseniibacteriota bacterium TaxID=2212470 RepID=A0A832I442_UNCEI